MAIIRRPDLTVPSTTMQVTQLLMDWRDGNHQALEELIPLVQAELKRLARNYLRREWQEHTLQTSALVNEAFLRLVDHEISWQNRALFRHRGTTDAPRK